MIPRNHWWLDVNVSLGWCKKAPFLAPLCALWDLSSSTRVWTQLMALKEPGPNHWTTREVPESAHILSNADLSIWQWIDVLPRICLNILWPRKTNQGNKKRKETWSEAKSRYLLSLDDEFMRGSWYCSLCIYVRPIFFTRILVCLYFKKFIYLFKSFWLCHRLAGS